MCKTKTKIFVCIFLILQNASLQASNIQQASTPTGPAGGALTGSYPNPTLTGVTTLGAIAVGSSTSGVLSQVTLGSAGALLYAGASGPLWSSTSALAWDAANGRLGINSNSPGTQLDIVQVGSTAGLRVRDGTNPQIRVEGNSAVFAKLQAVGAAYALFGTESNHEMRVLTNNTDRMAISAAGVVNFGGVSSVGIGPSNTSPTGTMNVYDATPITGSTSLNVRAGAGQSGNVLRVLDSTATDVAGISAIGNVQARSFQSFGTTFTASGCSVSTLVGGATAGRYTSGTTGTCTVTVTMGNSATATNGWSCSISNRTTANLMRQTAATTTTATFEGTTVSGDVIGFGCIGN